MRSLGEGVRPADPDSFMHSVTTRRMPARIHDGMRGRPPQKIRNSY